MTCVTVVLYVICVTVVQLYSTIVILYHSNLMIFISVIFT